MLDKRGGSASRRRRRKVNGGVGAIEPEPIEAMNSEDYIKEQQQKLEQERESLLQNNGLIVEVIAKLSSSNMLF